jgi:hypothetical protein
VGGSGGSFKWPSREELKQATEAAGEAATSAAFGSELAGQLSELLASFNSRDAALVTRRLDDIRSAIEGVTEGTIDTLYGGSVAKHTYVDGLSDIDTLLIINEAKLNARRPSRVRARLASLLADALGANVAVEQGKMAVTLTFADGMMIQCLPALRMKDGVLKVSSSRGKDEWSEINPEAFQGALTRRNQQCGNKLVPTIKLAKAINAGLPADVQLSGYHIESLAIAAFRNYTGEKTPVRMLPVFFEKASQLVLSPIRDSSGQSVHVDSFHVDSYLGLRNSPERLRASQLLSRIHRRMRNATASESLHEWRAFFG